MPDDEKLVACTHCKTIGYPKWETPGSGATEVVLWLLFLVPGIVYSIWRSNAAASVCPSCGSKAVVPLSTPAGQEIQRAYPPAVPLSPKPPKAFSERDISPLWLLVFVLLIIIILIAFVHISSHFHFEP
jgi:hypothetical protein